MLSSTSKSSQKINGQHGKKKRVIPTTKDYKIIFDRMEAGTIKVDVVEGKVCVKYKGKWIEPYISLDDEDLDKAYRFVTIYYKNRRRKIAVHRLVWMVDNGEESIPEGYDVAHDDDDPGNNCNWNLDLEPNAFNRRNSSTFNSKDEDF